MDRQPILIVDDEAVIRETLEEALGNGGYLVETAGSAQEALRKLKAQRYAVVLADLHMPGGASGLELLSEIRGLDPGIMVVILTGFATLETAIGALKGGAYDFVQKPFKMRDIQVVLDRALEHERVLRELEQYQKELEQRVLARTQDLLDYHAEVLRLNELTLNAAGEMDPALLLPPFLAFLKERCHPDGVGVWSQGAGEGRELLSWEGGPAAPLGDALPPLAPPGEILEWRGGPFPETHLLRLGDQDADGILLLGFRQRSSFIPEDRVFALWRRQLGALLRARRKTLQAFVRLPAGGRRHLP